MHRLTITIITVLLVASSTALAQKWEFGAVGGASIYTSQTATSGTASADAGFKNGYSAGVLVGNNISDHVGGEVRYLYSMNDLEVKSGSARAGMSAQSHAIHYDLLFHFTPRNSRVRPFVSVGGGTKYYRSTGNETAFQPLSNLVLLTRANEWKGMFAVGGGVKIAVSKHVSLRAEFKDYISPIPTKLLTPARNAQLSGWMQNFVPLFGIVYTN